MFSPPQHRSSADFRRLRQAAGGWLRSLPEKRQLSKREFAPKVDFDYYRINSQLRTGCCRIPPDRYRLSAELRSVDTKSVVRELMRSYDSITHEFLFPDAGRGRASHLQRGSLRALMGRGVGRRACLMRPLEYGMRMPVPRGVFDRFRCLSPMVRDHTRGLAPRLRASPQCPKADPH